MMLLALIVSCSCAVNLALGGRVDSIEPKAGSLNGETRITIYGEGFAASQFDMFDDVGNKVSLVSTTQILDCPVHKDGTHETQVMCYTPKGMPADDWQVRVAVDGEAIPDANHCSRNANNCKFTTRESNTPKINRVMPIAGEPKKVIQVNGKLFTDRFETNKAVGCNGEVARFSRVYVGSLLCELRHPDGSDEYYGIGLDADCSNLNRANELCLAGDCDSSWGYFKCMTTGSYVGYQNVSFLINEQYGRSLPEPQTMRVTAAGRIAMYETYAIITSVSPSTGSNIGGTLVTITGNYFDDTDFPAEILVGGVPCKVIKMEDTEIICETPEKPANIAGIGNRGIIKEFFNDTDPADRTTYNMGVAEVTNFTNPDGVEYLEELGWKAHLNDHNYYATRHRGFIVAPSDGTYELFIKGDDHLQLYLSPSEDPEEKELVAYTTKASNNYATFGSQRSGRFNMESGKKYYFELNHMEAAGQAQVNMKMHKYDTYYTANQAGNVQNEQQSITVYSTVTGETTRIVIDDLASATAKDEVQVVRVTSSNNAAVFRIGVYDCYTEALDMGSPASTVQSALGKTPVLTGFTVTVSAKDVTNGMEYTITLKGDGGDWPNFEVVAGNDESEGAVSSTVTESTKGVASNSYYQIGIGGTISGPIEKTASANKVQEAIEGMYESHCPAKITSAGGRQHYFTYETNPKTMQYFSGARVTEIPAFCGRYSLKNPAYLFGNWGTTADIDAKKKGKLCFAYNGDIRQRIDVYHTFTTLSSQAVAWDIFEVDLPVKDGWGYVCFDMYAAMVAKRPETLGSKIHRIVIYREEDSYEDFYVDEVYIGGNMLVDPEDGPGVAKFERKVPDKWIMDTVTVTGDTSEFTIDMTILNCESNIPKMSLPQNGGSVTITRDSTASPPVTGSFDLTYDGQSVTNIPVDIEAEDLRARLETLRGLGQVTVTRTGTCAGYSWLVEMVEGAPGDHPQMTIDDGSVSGTDAHANATTVQDGGEEFDPLLGDMLRIFSDTPQISVTINKIPSLCKGDCGFEWTDAATPTITGIDPTDGSETASTTLTITGTGFSTSLPNNVTIGDTECVVTSSTSTEIQCDIGQGPAGPHEVILVVQGKGLAEHIGATDGVFKFTYNYQVLSIDPTSGSEAGGTLLTVTGTGFGDILNVTIDSNFCEVLESSYEEIVCKTPAGSGSNHAVTVSDGSNSASGPGYTYDPALTPSVTSLSDTIADVEGGTQITISGTSLGSSAPNNSMPIELGGEPVQIDSWTDTSIEVTLPSLGPGNYSLVFNLENGFADTSAIGDIAYMLEVNGVSPSTGSMQGGLEVVITGKGFSTNSSLNAVSFGGVGCEIISSTETEIKCISGSPSQTVEVDNQGISATHGEGYAWSPKLVNIQVGDSVQWSWTTPPLLNGIGYRVEQTATETANEFAGSGFQSSTVKSTMGVYKYQFTNPGTFYYWSGNVDDAGTIKMRGTVTVTDYQSESVGLSVRVNGHEADYMPSGGSRRRKRSACSDVTGNIDGCTDSIPSNENTFSFTFYTCATPKITDITPTQGHADTVVTITGQGFGTEDCQNTVTVNGYDATVTSSSATEIQFTVDPDDSLKVGVPHQIKINVADRGLAIVSPINPLDRTFVLLPLVRSLSPAAGSIAGGTVVTISGSGFMGTKNTVSVTMAGTECVIANVSYTEIVCTTGSAYATSGDISVQVSTVNGLVPAECPNGCSFAYEDASTPTVTAIDPTTITTASESLTITGTNFGTDTGVVEVMIGTTECTVSTVTNTEIVCDAGQPISGTQPLSVLISNLGMASSSVTSINVVNSLTSVTPNSGSVMGGTELTLAGLGFKDGDTSVLVGGSSCSITSVTPVEIVCNAPEAANTGGDSTVDIEVTSNSITYSTTLSYDYQLAQTPTISGISPSSGSPGDAVTISGTGFGTTNSDVMAYVGTGQCTVNSVTATSIGCTLGNNAAGDFYPSVNIAGKGLASGGDSHQFTYSLAISSISPSSGSFGGGQVITISGSGFQESITNATICGVPCTINTTSTTAIECTTPAYTMGGGNEDCDVVVNSGEATATEADGFTYDTSLTPTISAVDPVRGGTGGGTSVTITGTNFGTTQGDITVTIDGVECAVNSLSDTEIECTTGAHQGAIETKIRVEKGSVGIATQDNADFQYIDVWSSPFTWGGGPLPEAGDFLVIPKGMTVLLDTDTPIILYLLIQGGKLIFDDKDVELRARNILITDGGLLQVGTEEEPFQHKGIITMYGVTTDKEMPIYGTKCIALREGRLELHGKHVGPTWTVLGATAQAGATTITVQGDISNWDVGSEIVIATTGHRHSQNENEKKTIQAISGSTITLDSALEYKHLGEDVDFGSATLSARAEVGLLTRNVVVRGSNNVQWNDEIPRCEEGFDTGEFATQTCFQGRFGEEIGSDQFGAHIIMHAPRMDEDLVQGHIENVEVTNAGQAFRLGRYAIHFHLNGDMTGSYVRGCSIHQSYNRAINVHGTHNLVLEHNVGYNIMGGAFFTEDGVETGHFFQYNLAVFVKSSTSLQNDDITPAAYWVTNPNNTVRHNHAAGGTHFGFWYRMHEHPDAGSFDPNICPQIVPLGVFTNNTVHSQGWFGVWIFEHFYPVKGGVCGETADEPADFNGLISWNCEKGAETVGGSSIKFTDFMFINNEVTGYDFKLIDNLDPESEYTENAAPQLSNGVIAGNGGGVLYDQNTEQGIKLPYGTGFLIKDVEFVDMEDRGCLGGTDVDGTTTDNNGGYTFKTTGLTFTNSNKKTIFRWPHEFVVEDLDGSLTGTAGSKVVPYEPSLPSSCTQSGAEAFAGNSRVPGAICPPDTSFHRFSFNHALPSSLEFKNTSFTSSQGTGISQFKDKRVTHKMGWHTLLASKETYLMEFVNAEAITNISFSGRIDDFEDDDYVFIKFNFSQRADRFHILDDRNQSDSPLTSDSYSGDWYYDDNQDMLEFIISSKKLDNSSGTGNDFDLNFHVYQCYYADCGAPIPVENIPPASSRPDDAVYWSNKEAWAFSADEYEDYGSHYGGGDYGPPTDNTDVIIPAGVWMVADTTLPQIKRLYIHGTLEFEHNQVDGSYLNLTLSATHILISGGRLIVGWEETPFQGNAVIELRGDHNSKDITVNNGPNVGSKCIGVFGGLDLHGKDGTISWTQLSSTGHKDSSVIEVEELGGWEVGNQIVIASTSFNPDETEVHTISAITGTQITLTSRLQYDHKVVDEDLGDGKIVRMAAEVGLLSRNVRVIGADYAKLQQESFGARVIMGYHNDIDDNGDIQEFFGYARLSNVEFYHAGQEGWTETYDPRFAVTFLDTGDTTEGRPGYIKGCSFNENFSPAIGLFGANGIEISDNVIYRTVGSSMLIHGTNHILDHNLVVLMKFAGTYNGKREERLQIDAGIEIQESVDIVFTNNHVAASENAGIRMDGERCPVDGVQLKWGGNVAHSSLIGALLFLDNDGLPPCSSISNLTVYRCYDWGIYAITEASLIFSNYISIDNGVGVLPFIMGPAAGAHLYESKYVEIIDSYFVGTSSAFDCDEGMPNLPAFKLFPMLRGFRHPDGGMFGVSMGSFQSGDNGSPKHALNGIMAYQAIRGITRVKGTTFSKYGGSCNAKSFAITAQSANDDAIHPLEISETTLNQVDHDNKVFFSRPRIETINPADCVDMDCDGLKKTLVKDLDGTFLGTGQSGSVIAESEFEWDGDPVRGLGDFRIPIVMLTDANGDRIQTADMCPNKGIYRDETCTYKPTYQAWQCATPDYYMLMLESMDWDTETRRLSPIAVYSDGYVDLVNGPQDHGWCMGYTCQERLSLFPIILAANQQYNIYLSGTTPQHMRYHWLNNADAAVLVGLWYAQSFRLDVYADETYILPTNGEYNGQGQLITNNPPANDPDMYLPDVSSAPTGSNFWDPTTNILWLILKGGAIIDVKTQDSIVVTFGVPAMSVDEFFGANIVANLAAFFNVPASKIKYAKAVSESSRKKRDTTETVIITIENPPGDFNTTDPDDLSTEQLAAISASIITTYQLGGLEDALNVTIVSMTVVEPPPSSDSEKWQVMAELGIPDPVALQVPDVLEVTVQPVIIHEGTAFSTQPKLRFKDREGAYVTQVGSELVPWQIQMTLLETDSSDERAVILGTDTAPISQGWANFTDLGISHSGSYILNFTVVDPVGASHFTVSYGPVTVNDRALGGKVESASNTTYVDVPFGVDTSVIDAVTGETIEDLSWKNQIFTCDASIYMPDTYSGELSGSVSEIVDSNSSMASYENLTLSAVGRCNIEFRCVSDPEFYDFTFLSDQIDIFPEGYTPPIVEVSKRVTLRFDGDFATVAAGKEVAFANAVYNALATKYLSVRFKDFTIYEGSIMADFYVEGTASNVANTTNGIWEDLKVPLTILVNGVSVEAEEVMWVDGDSFYGNDGPSTASSALEPWAIALIVLFVIIAVVGIVLIIVYLKYKNSRKGERKLSMAQHGSSLGSRTRVGPDTKESKEKDMFGSKMTQKTAHVSYDDDNVRDDKSVASSASSSRPSSQASGTPRVIVPRAAPASTALPNHLQWQRSHSGLYRSNAVDPLPPPAYDNDQ